MYNQYLSRKKFLITEILYILAMQKIFPELVTYREIFCKL